MTPIELLAPARNLECGKSAILVGADAVYMGGPNFSARKNAGNSLKDITQMTDFAHFYGAKVYAGLNTVLLEHELLEAEKLIWEFYKAKVDAIIIQDMGILEMNLPPIALFASTQTHNITLEKVKFLEKTGFKRVILARELTLKQISEISALTTVELEVFVHGALCVSQSGRCFLSYALGGRSGNRGACAQPCRDVYSLVDKKGQVLEKNKHLLSLKDLNLSNYLEELIDAGITSFKIEGRLKDTSYAMNVTAAYRQALDRVLEKKGLARSSVGKSFYDFTPNLNKTFNRGYSSYFFKERQSFLANFDTPKWKGELIGQVTQLGKDWFSLSQPVDLSPADGLSFISTSKVLKGTSVNAVQQQKIFPNSIDGIKKGLQIFRNFDYKFDKHLNIRIPQRKIGVHVEFWEETEKFCLQLTDETGCSIIHSEIFEKNIAQNTKKSEQILEKQFLKMGDSAFYPLSFKNKLNQAYFFKISVLNEMRRKALFFLEQKRRELYTGANSEKIQIIPYFEKKLTFEANVTNSLAKKFYLKRGVEKIDLGAEVGGNLKEKKLMTLKYCLWFERGQCLKKSAVDKILILKQSKGRELKLLANCEKCENEVYLNKK